MITARRIPGFVFLVAGLLSIACLCAPGSASATTGPTQFLPDAKYKVNNKVELLYTGTYIVSHVASAARLSGGAMAIEINDRGYLYGLGQFYGYDAQGHQSVWTGTLYNFHQIKSGEMIFDVVPPTGRGTLILARMFVSRAKSGDLSGQIELSGHRFAIAWHKLPKH
jgi:hypothetical protein